MYLRGVLLCAVLASSLAADLEWWQKKAIYQIYVPSFRDSDNDGVGDLQGIYDNVDYLKSLDVGAVWLSPIFESPMKDNGYDVKNYTAINPMFGNFIIFDALVKKLNDSGIFLVLDYVPNHTSNEHDWFIKSENSTAPYTDYYIWKDGIKEDAIADPKPPNNWLSVFGGSAWTWSEKRKQFYYHAFAEWQPDLNYTNSNVTEIMKEQMSFWLNRNVYGFRMDAVPFLVEAKNFSNEPPICPEPIDVKNYGCLNHTLTVDQDGTYDVLREFRKILDSFAAWKDNKRMMVVEAYSPIDKLMKYYGTSSQPIAQMPFNFNLLNQNQISKGQDFIDSINGWMKNVPKDAWSNWVTGNHDKTRVGTRMGSQLIDGMNMLKFLLPGTPFVYYGEEIGMVDTFVRPDQTNDTSQTSNPRDPQRTPFQWNNGLNGGFSNGTHTWLPLNPNYWDVNLKNEDKESNAKESNAKESTHLQIYKRLNSLHQKLNKNVTVQNFTTFGNTYTFGFMRQVSKDEKYVYVLNLNNQQESVNLSQSMDVTKDVFVHTASVNSMHKQGEQLKSENLTLRAMEGIVLSTGVASHSSVLMSSFVLLMVSLAFLSFQQ